MRKVVAIAKREYMAAVKTKSFIASLLLMPALMVGSTVIQLVVRKQSDTEDKRFAIVDRTPGGKVFEALAQAAAARNEKDIFDPETGEKTGPLFLLERIEPSAGDEEAVNQQRLDISARVLRGKYVGFVEIGPDVGKALALGLLSAEGIARAKERTYLRYQTNRTTYRAFPQWVEREILVALFRPGNSPDAKAYADRMQSIQQMLALKTKGLSMRDARTGAIVDPPLVHVMARYIVPAGLVVVMFMVVLLAATPGMQGVVEEKMQRIAEVLLGSVRPFELMLGKLLGLMGVSLTVAATYVGGAYGAAWHYGFTEFLTPELLAWFVVYQILAVLMYGSIFLAIGAAVTDIKESQTLVLPVTLVACIPLFVLVIALENPNHGLVTALSFFPPVTPMLMMARQAVPPGVPWWQPIVAVIWVLVITIACVYAAGRIFRVGILLQGKGAKVSDLLKWIVTG